MNLVYRALYGFHPTLLLLATAMLACSLHAAGTQPNTEKKSETAEESFSEHGQSIFQVRIINVSSKSQSALGSGFFIGDGTLLATNYHVVSSVVLNPEKYNAEIEINGQTHALNVLAIDVIHDLAILAVPTQAKPLQLSTRPPAKGARLYSMGNPLDIGMTIVEGNYNGLVENRFFDQIHFSGAVNSGMSGGPTLNERGEVVGINVASAGNQVGFLVPVDKLATLLGKASQITETSPTQARSLTANLTEDGANKESASGHNTQEENPFFEMIATQIQTATHTMINQLLENDWPLENLGEARVAGKAHSAVDCWGDSAEQTEKKIKYVQKGCNSRDGFFISRRLNSGFIEYEFSYAEGEEWPVSAFYQKMSQEYSMASPGNRAGKKDVDNYTCLNRVISRPNSITNESTTATTAIKRKVSYCTRPYKKLKGLYDTFYLGLTLDKKDRVLLEHFTLSGVSKEDGERFLNRFITQVRWQ